MGPRTGACDAARFPARPLIKPDVPICGIRLSDWLHRRLTNRPHGADPEIGIHRVPRRSASSKIDGCLAMTPCAAASGNAADALQRVHQAPHRPSLGSPIRNTLRNLGTTGSAGWPPLPGVLHCWALDALPLSA